MSLETFKYDDAIVRKFVVATIIWGAVGMLVGLLAALELSFWQINGGVPWLVFSRISGRHSHWKHAGERKAFFFLQHCLATLPRVNCSAHGKRLMVT